MSRNLSRRDFMKYNATVALAGVCASPFLSRTSYGATVTPEFQTLEETRTFSMPPDFYYGWPTIAKRDNELIVVASGGREGHVCPFGRVDLFRSNDNGRTWTWPQTIYDSPIDDRDAGVCVTNKGTILVTTFTSLAYVGMLDEETKFRSEGKARLDIWSDGRYEKWMAVHRRLTDEQRQKIADILRREGIEV